MSIAYSDILAEIASCLELVSTDTDALSRFEVVRNANNAQRFILSNVPERHVSNAIRNVTRDLTISVADYEFPDDYVRMVAVWINSKRAIIRNQSEADNKLSRDKMPSDIYPVVTLDRERGYRVRPTPIATVTGGQELQYVHLLPSIASDQASLLDDSLKNLLIFKAVEYCGLMEANKVEISKVYAEKFNQELSLMIPDKGKK